MDAIDSGTLTVADAGAGTVEGWVASANVVGQATIGRLTVSTGTVVDVVEVCPAVWEVPPQPAKEAAKRATPTPNATRLLTPTLCRWGVGRKRGKNATLNLTKREIPCGCVKESIPSSVLVDA